MTEIFNNNIHNQLILSDSNCEIRFAATRGNLDLFKSLLALPNVNIIY
jgi:hypothetical protein